MKFRTLGKTGFAISEIGLGTWQVGGRWGDAFNFELAEKIITRALDNGINFIDTADVYGDGGQESEKAVGKVIKARAEKIYVATKCGRQITPHTNDNYHPTALRKYVEASLKNMGLEALDLIQLHCPPTEVYYRPEIFELFDRLKEEGKILNMGVSVEKIEEAIKAIEFPNVTTVQIIFNMFRQRPATALFKEAKKRNVGIIVRVPLASGLLTGTFSPGTSFTKGDHRNFNRKGEHFDRGETFSGVDYETGLAAVEQLKAVFPGQENLASIALRWVLMFDEVSVVIPGASNPTQVDNNLKATLLSDLTEEQMSEVRKVYEKFIKKDVHQRW